MTKITGWRDKLAKRFLSVLAGKPVSCWISEDAKSMIDAVSDTSLIGAGAAIVIVHALEESGAQKIEFTLDRATVVVELLDQNENT